VTLLIVAVIGVVFGYKPVVMFHGYGGSFHDWDNIVGFIQKYHPGTQIYPLNLYNGDTSIFTPVLFQVEGIISYIQQQNLNDFHLLCHSQGALACRVVAQMISNVTIDTYISLSGPHMGQYGLIPGIQVIFPTIELELAYLILYREIIQATYSAAGYWNDPFRQTEYLTECLFLPIVNNQTFNSNSQEQKANFINLNKVALFGSPQDEIIQPWQSAFFGFWDSTQTQIIPMERQPIYTQDWIGLKTLNNNGHLQQTVVPNVKHVEWLQREDLFVKYLEPLLI